ncbi:MAG: hypothetical protein IIA67_09780, partial [Planctomycetes bacterium]|nr:hypothetical protein [Planctomycetota bacterium]
ARVQSEVEAQVLAAQGGGGSAADAIEKIDSQIENLVEIYQGSRNSYEAEGAAQPKVARRGGPMTFGKYKAGVYQNALKLGHKLGVFASSDHRSTNISFGGVYVKKFDRPGVFDALDARRTIAATDKIFMEFSCNGHMLGDIFETNDKPTLKIKVKGTIGSFWEPRARMYSQGLATLALCEASAMTLGDGKDKKPAAENTLFTNERLATTAQMGLNYIMDTQGPRGGWRYDPGEPGDTSVVGWQLMALKSGYLAGLKVEARTVAGVQNFLDSVQSQRGADYGYSSRSKGTIGTRAIGLLSRMYLGWPRQHPALAAGAKHLVKVKPKRDDVYFNYYATQVLSHYGGPLWQEWNVQMRESLVRRQSNRGHEKGSWYFSDPHGAQLGGRLYSTAMAAMTLEVYYRILPIYGKRSVERDAK